MRNRLKGFATVRVCTAERTNAFGMGQKMIFQVLLLLEGFVAAFEGALELTLVALKMPVQLALADELLVEANRTLEL